jgi:very-short-patch-repair endonuclease
MLPYNPRLKPLARELRRNMTDAETILWSKVRGKQIKGLQFYRQKNVGAYIVDFYCPAAKVIVEVDGGQHFAETGLREDAERDVYLKDLGFKVLRFSDREVLKDIAGVLERIYLEV